MLSLALGLFVSVFAFTACGSDDGDNSNPVVGTWVVTSSDYSDYPVNGRITFNNDGSASIDGLESSHESLRYTINGNTLEIQFINKITNDLKVATKGTFTIIGKEATYSFINYEKSKWWEDKTYLIKATKQ